MGRPLDDHDQQGVAVAAQFHVAKRTPVAYSARMASPMRWPSEVIADVHGQIVEYRAFGDSLQTFDANVADG